MKLFYSILFYSILFYSILFYSILFYSILFYSILFYSILFYSILFSIVFGAGPDSSDIQEMVNFNFYSLLLLSVALGIAKPLNIIYAFVPQFPISKRKCFHLSVLQCMKKIEKYRTQSRVLTGVSLSTCYYIS